jgi:hypothetical protein
MEQGNLFSNMKKPIIDRPLIAFAFLAQASQNQGDLLGGLAPIFKPIAKDKVGQRFDAVEFSNLARTLYGIESHPWAVDDLAPRLERAGLLVKNKVSKAGEEFVYADVTGEFDEVQESDIRQAVQKFFDFARPLLDRNQIKVDDKFLEDAFFNQLISMDFHSILLKPDSTKEEQKKDLGKLGLTPKPEKIEWEKEVSAQSKIDVLCASFIVESFSNDRPLYDLIVRIATGAMVAETVLNFQDPGTTANLNTLKVFLDAPFLMSILDLTGEQSTEYARNLCSQLISKGATINVFRHSIEEMQSNLRGAINGVEHGTGFGATARRLGQAAFRQYVSSVLNDLEGAVLQKGFKIVDVPNSTHAFQYFTAADENKFTSALGFYENTLARERDAASIAAILRLRLGKTTRMAKFHQSQYIFVTDNTRVAERSDSFTQNFNFRLKSDVPPVLTDRYLAGMIFVLFGGKAAELTHYRLLANCTAALEPRSDVISKIHRFLSQLDESKAEYFRALMTDERASQHMMQLTLGDTVHITSTRDAEQILEQVELKVGEKYKKEYEEKMAQERATHEEAYSDLKTKHENLAEEVRTSMANVIEVQNELKGWKNHSDELRNALEAEKLARSEEKRILIEDCVSAGIKASDRRHLEITIGLFFITVFGTFIGTEYVTSTWKIGASIGIFLSGFLASAGFYKNPEKLLGKHLENVRTCSFRQKAVEHHILKDIDQFEVNWLNGSARYLSPIRQNQ